MLRELRPVGPRTTLIQHPGVQHERAVPFQPGEVVTVDLRRLISVLRRRFRLFLAVALGVLGLVTVATWLAPREFRATAEVMLDRRNPKVTTGDNVLSAVPADSPAVDTQVEILKSAQLTQRVVRSLHLDRDPEFNPGPAGATPARPGDLQLVASRVRRNLDIKRSGLTYVIDVSFQAKTPAKAARIANEYARLYLAQQVEEKVDATQQAANWLSGQLQQLRGQLTSDEVAVQQFRIANNLLSSQGATLTEQELSNYNQSLAAAKAQAAEDRARLSTARAQLSRGSTGDDVGEALNSPTIQKLKEARAEASRRVASLRTSFRDDYPELKKAINELADLDGQIRAETDRVISNLDARAQVSDRRVSAIAASVGGAKSQLASNSRASVGLGELERNAQASRALYESYLARQKETSSQIGLAQADSTLVSLAAPPVKPSSPNIPLHMLVGAALAAMAGFAAVGIAELLESGLATSADVERRFNLRYLGAIPSLRSVAKCTPRSPIDYIVERPASGFAEAFRSLLAAIIHGPEGAAVRTVAITSALPNEGKTTIAICLARAAAVQGYRVVLVDCDLRRRGLERVAGKVEAGLMEVLSGAVPLDTAIVKDSESEADLLPLSEAPLSLADVFGSPRMSALLEALRARYDLVILDTPPVVPVADARVIGRQVDFVAVVARWRSTPYQAIQGALGLLSGSNVEADGIVLNQVDIDEQMRHGYGDLAYYFNSYRNYYLEYDGAPASRRSA